MDRLDVRAQHIHMRTNIYTVRTMVIHSHTHTHVHTHVPVRVVGAWR